MIKVAVMGCGTIGSGVYEVIEGNQAEIRKAAGEEVRVSKILDLRTFPGTPYEKLVVGDIARILEDPEILIVVETMGGTKPAYQFVKACLLAGKHVVTSNKALVAAHGTELLRIAREQNVNFFFEASVGGGIPVIRTLSTGYAGQEITEISGILNGTTNFILTKMSREGADFAATLAEAQRLGYAERNPEADIEGHDTCRKISILASLMLDKEVNFEEVHTEGITKIGTAELLYAEKLNASVRLIGSAVCEADGAALGVCPMLVGRDNPLYGVNDVYNGILVRGNMLGTTMLYGSGAGKLPTASAVLADVIEAVRNIDRNVPFGWHEGKPALKAWEDSTHRYLVRLEGDPETAAAAFGGAEIIRLEQLPGETAVLTGPMQEKKYLETAARVAGIQAMIRAEL